MLKGEFEHSIDAKGRTVLPAKMRDEVGEQFVITAGSDHCLFGYSLKEWSEFEKTLNALPTVTNPQAANLARFFLSKASDCETDKQGRFPIPLVLRNFAGLTKDIVIIGTGKRFEIWDKEVWAAKNAQITENFSDIFVGLEGQGISF